MSAVFGPVPSRRLGYSLGVDLVPPERKTCAFDCVYCQVGRTGNKSIERTEMIPTAAVIKELEKQLPKENIHYVTFSGTGEPTLHKDLGKIIDRIHDLCPTPVAVITNSALIERNDVQRDLAKADLVVPSLDAVRQETFEKINRPHSSLRIDRIIKGLTAFSANFHGDLWLETMFVKGVNDGLDELLKFKETIELINPDKIHVNTPTRPPVESWVQTLEPTELERIAAMFGEKALVIGIPPSRDYQAMKPSLTELEEEVIELIKRRGVTLNDLVQSLGMHRDVANDILEKLIADKRAKKAVHGGVTYFREHY